MFGTRASLQACLATSPTAICPLGDQLQGDAGASVSPFWRRRTLTKAIQAKMTTVPARVAAPSPTVEKAAFAAKTAGTVRRLGIHESRQAGFRRNANARTSGARSENAAVKPDSILWARECHETLSHAASAERTPQAEPEQDHEDAREVRSDLVVDPGARG